MAAPPQPAFFPEPRFLRRARTALRLIGRIELFVLVAALVGVSVLTAIGIVLRYLFGSSLVWAQEVSLLMLQILVFSGAAVVYKARVYITMGFLFERLPEPLQHLMALATWVIASAFFATVFWQGVLLYPKEINVTTFILELPKFYYTVPLIYATASLLAASLYYAATAAVLLAKGSSGEGPTVESHEAATTILPGTSALA